MSSSHYTFQGITSVALFAGIVCLNCKTLSNSKTVYGFIFLVSATILFVLSVVLISSVLWKLSEGGSANITLGVMYSYGIVLGIHYLANGERITNNLHDLLELKEIFSVNSKLEKYSFEYMLLPHFRRLNIWIKLQFWFNFIIVPVDVFFKALGRVELMDFKNENDLVYAIYFDVTDSAVFWPTIIFQSVGLHIFIVMQTVNDLYILNVTLLLVLSFKHLRLKLGSVLDSTYKSNKYKNEGFNRFDNPVTAMKYFGKLPHNRKIDLDKVDQEVKTWIQCHTYLLRLCRDFVQLFAPVLAAYFFNVFLGVCFGIFIVTQDQINFFSPVEKIIIGSYFIGNAVNLMFMCMAGTYLILESTNVFEDAFYGSWYKCSKTTKTNLSIISTVAQHPVRLTPVCSNSAELSLETFIWMLRAMVSFYMALTQVKAKFNNSQ